MADEIGRKIDATATETTKKVKSFFAGLDLYTTIAVIAALAMALFGNFFVVMNPFILAWSFWACLVGAIVIGFAIFMEITQNKISFMNLSLWMKVSLWVGAYVFITSLIGYIRFASLWMSPFGGLLR